jgi:FMN phosphatase YigB (HAD superfamily)
MSEKLSDGIKACVFDAYGTLFDVHSAVRGYLVND